MIYREEYAVDKLIQKGNAKYIDKMTGTMTRWHDEGNSEENNKANNEG